MKILEYHFVYPDGEIHSYPGPRKNVTKWLNNSIPGTWMFNPYTESWSMKGHYTWQWQYPYPNHIKAIALLLGLPIET